MTAADTRRVRANISLTLDGRYNGPGGPGDLSAIVPYATSEVARDHLTRIHEGATTALLGRRNAEGFLGYWPSVADDAEADLRDRGYARWLVENGEGRPLDDADRGAVGAHPDRRRPCCRGRRRAEGLRQRRHPRQQQRERHPGPARRRPARPPPPDDLPGDLRRRRAPARRRPAAVEMDARPPGERRPRRAGDGLRAHALRDRASARRPHPPSRSRTTAR